MNPTELSSDVDEETSGRRRSVWVWLILGWAVWSVIGTLGMWWSVFHPMSDAELQAAAAMLGASAAPPRMTLVAAAAGTVVAAVLLAGAWKLFMLRAIAIRIFWIAAAMSVLGSLVNMVTMKDYGAMLKTPIGLSGLLFGVVFYALLLWYSTRLLRRGVLQ